MVNAVKYLDDYMVLNESFLESQEELVEPEFFIVHKQKQGSLEIQSIKEFLNIPNFKGNSQDQFISCMRSNQALQVSALVGRQVLVHKDFMLLGIEGAVFAAIEIPNEINNLVVSIYNKSGIFIKQLTQGQASQGFFQFSWDGTGQDNQRLSAGRYKIKAHGNYRGEILVLRTLAIANIDSVSLGNDGKGIKLNIAGVGLVSLSY